MKYVLDTHIFLWLCFEPQKISSAVLELLEKKQNQLIITSLTFWEISLKYSLGKLTLSGVTPEDLVNAAEKMGITKVNLDSSTLASYHKLNKVENYKDPFYRAIIWYCISEQLTLVSADSKFHSYQKYGLNLLKA